MKHDLYERMSFTLIQTTGKVVRFQDLSAASMKLRIFLDVLPYSSLNVTDVSEVHAAFIIKAISRRRF
jgi:hypothetical protein